MAETEPNTAALLARTAAPEDREVERLDVRDLPPPEPLSRTLDRAADLGTGTVLLGLTDRVPQHLYPKLEERGLAYDTVEAEAAVATAVWRGD